MPYSTPLSYEHEDRDSTTVKWVVLFVLLSLVAHALLIVTLIFLSKHIPAPRLESTATSPTVTMTMIQPPKPVVMPPKPKPIFMVTPDQKNAIQKESQIESNHNTVVASQSKTGRKPDSIMPDVESKNAHPTSLDSSPSAPPAKPEQTQTTPPSPKADPSKQPPTPTPPQPPQPPQPEKADPSKTPPQPTKVPPPPKPTPAPPPKVPPPPAVDDNGLPVLPALTAQTLAPQTTSSTQPQQVATPQPMMPVVPANVQGRAGISGQPSPQAMKTALGEYKARFYQAVGSRWYQKIAQQMQLIGVGSVRVQYTISPSGIVTYKVLDSGGSGMLLLLTASVGSIRDTSPFIPFPPAMLKEYPDGYTDDFSFSIY